MPIKHLREVVSEKIRSSKNKKAGWKRIAMTMLAVGGGIALIGFFILTLMLAWMSKDLPNPNALLDRNVAQSTKIYDRTGEVLLYEIHGDEQRTLVEIKDIPDVMKWATIAIEDKSFYKHHGVSWKGLIRAFITSVIKRDRVGGTSTLTQQFVKNAILTNERSVTRKLKELLLSLQIERKYEKDQILQMYLNEIPYGSTMYGIESAAQGYFGKSAKDLTLDEAALLASIPQSSDVYNPYGTGSRGDYRDLLVGRQHYVLDQMAEQGYITKEEAASAKEIKTLEKLIPRQIGNIKAPHFVMMVRGELVERYGQRMVETGGLKVITTLDWRLQQAAEKAVAEGVDARGERYGFTNASLIAIGPKDGHILAMVGSRDYFNDEIDGQVNVTLSKRQPGSSFKPIVYAKGFEKGYLPETILWDVETDFKTDSGNYHPHNYSMNQNGPVSIRKALQGSLNIPAVKMLYLAGVGNVLDFATKLGYTTFEERDRFGLALVLGGGEVKLVEHAAAYGAFANDGVLQPTASILSVEERNGNKLEEWKLSEGARVMDQQIARLTSNVLSDNAARSYVFGGANSLTLPGRPVAAKTGTTNDYHDAWTLGYTPSLVTGVWVGNSRNEEMKRGADGSIIAAPIWKAFMSEAVKDTPVESFVAPAAPAPETRAVLLGKTAETTAKIDTVTGKLATEYTPPELVEERSFREAHSILWYVDKENPTGPAPEHPERDPQFSNWEKAVQDWATKENWNATSTAPSEYDDVHTKENVPTVQILSPQHNNDVRDRSLQLQVRIYASRSIRSAKASIEGYVIGSSSSGWGDTWNISTLIPNAIEKGFHTVVVEVTDDVGNKGTAEVTINLLADQQDLEVMILNPAPGTTFHENDFPQTVGIQISDMTDIRKADLYIRTPFGQKRLVGSNIKPEQNPVEFSWAYMPGPGSYGLYAEVSRDDGERIKSDEISITVLP